MMAFYMSVQWHSPFECLCTYVTCVVIGALMLHFIVIVHCGVWCKPITTVSAMVALSFLNSLPLKKWNKIKP